MRSLSNSQRERATSSTDAKFNEFVRAQLSKLELFGRDVAVAQRLQENKLRRHQRIAVAARYVWGSRYCV